MVEQESESTFSDAISSILPAIPLTFENRGSGTLELLTKQLLSKRPNEEPDAVSLWPTPQLRPDGQCVLLPLLLC